MQFCLEVWGTDYSKIKDTCILAEKLGYNGFYYGESLAEIDLDCWSILSGLAAQTNKIKLGPVITYLLPQYRNIALLAKQAVTLQEMSNGRLEFRTGAGATLQYAAQWWYPYGIDYPKNAERVAMLEEGLHVLHMLWNNSSVQFNGKYFKVNGASLHKPSKSIPVTVAAKRAKMMRIAARYADIWEASYLSPEKFKAMNTKFDLIAKEVGRNVKRSIELDVIIADSDSDLKYKEQKFAMERGPNVYHQILQNGLVGKPDKIAERVKEYTDAGVEQFFLAFQDPFDAKALELFTNAVNGKL
jgi:alkanesulfonate monooxygenase SsuD/methylene tetrahydromethanopterin reductase-like flavin-dependent oxidoreductase (luciferase family)